MTTVVHEMHHKLGLSTLPPPHRLPYIPLYTYLPACHYHPEKEKFHEKIVCAGVLLQERAVDS